MSENSNNTKIVAKKAKAYEIKVLQRFARAKKLLVLDLDHTLLHDKWEEFVPEQRPFLHQFLAKVAKSFNLMIWSDSPLDRIWSVLEELGMDSNKDYGIKAILCRKAVVNIKSEGAWVRCKPLSIIWNKYPFFGPQNTIIVDDIEENFFLNKKSGVLIKEFRAGMKKDVELLKLGKYLVKIARRSSFENIDHTKWESN
ncbi:uncharacterized protein LOC132198449 [Neocloeon triangulifer]|uniref:uncharacterized protein LOC132198449 n=1 Tax=Neocloeon triangulifer TaxID=2078957 RepID=UPI00286EE8FD|nr:uncharacterized protein LOC132198449 [Neocloeon triangulifer]